MVNAGESKGDRSYKGLDHEEQSETIEDSRVASGLVGKGGFRLDSCGRVLLTFTPSTNDSKEIQVAYGKRNSPRIRAGDKFFHRGRLIFENITSKGRAPYAGHCEEERKSRATGGDRKEVWTAQALIDWLHAMGWESTPEKIERLRAILENRDE